MVAKTKNNSNSKDGAEKIRSEGGHQAALKKGPWTAAEDVVLMEYVRKHGEGNWNAVQRNCGLSRCGKSCRLRWANHLRPNLKKGSFTPDEERLIIELHAKIGNKWARMASQLPGRTDNEIKNYWNTRVKRLQRAGLPIYPDDIPHNYQDHPQNRQTNPNSPISPPPYSSQFNTSLSFLNPILNFPTLINPPFLPHSLVGNRRVNLDRSLVPSGSIGNLPMPLISSLSPFASPPSSLFGQNFSMGGTFSPFGIVSGPGKIELSSIQTQAMSLVPSTSASSATTGSASWADNIIATRGEGYYASNALEEGNNNNNSGLLETLLEESNAIAKAKKLKSEDLFGNGLLKEISEEGDSNHGPNSSPLYSSCGMKEEPMEESNHLDDDLSSLLNNFVQVPDWYDATTTANVYTQKEKKSEPVIATNSSTNTKWDTRSCCWKNMPSVC